MNTPNYNMKPPGHILISKDYKELLFIECKNCRIFPNTYRWMLNSDIDSFNLADLLKLGVLNLDNYIAKNENYVRCIKDMNLRLDDLVDECLKCPEMKQRLLNKIDNNSATMPFTVIEQQIGSTFLEVLESRTVPKEMEYNEQVQ